MDTPYITVIDEASDLPNNVKWGKEKLQCCFSAQKPHSLKPLINAAMSEIPPGAAACTP